MSTDPGGEALIKAGLNHLMSIISGFHGPREVPFKGTKYEILFMAYSILGDAMNFCHVVLCLLTPIFMPELELKDILFFTIPLITSSYSLIRIFFVNFNRSKFIKLLIKNEEASRFKYDEKNLQQLMTKWSERARVLQPVLFFLVAAPIVPWGMSPFANEILDHRWGPRTLPTICWYPFDTTTTLNWFLVSNFQLLVGCRSTLSNVMFDAIFFCLSFRLLALLQNLRKSFKKIFEAIRVDSAGRVQVIGYNGDFSTEDEIQQEIKVKLKYWVRSHQTVLELLIELRQLYSFPLTLQFVYVGMVLATGSAAILKGAVSPLNLFFIVVHLMGVCLTLFVICRIGDYIKFMSAGATEKLIGQNYFVLNKENHASLKIIMTYMQQPFAFEILGTFPLSTESFRSIMGTTYSVFAMFARTRH